MIGGGKKSQNFLGNLVDGSSKGATYNRSQQWHAKDTWAFSLSQVPFYDAGDITMPEILCPSQAYLPSAPSKLLVVRRCSLKVIKSLGVWWCRERASPQGEGNESQVSHSTWILKVSQTLPQHRPETTQRISIWFKHKVSSKKFVVIKYGTQGCPKALPRGLLWKFWDFALWVSVLSEIHQVLKHIWSFNAKRSVEGQFYGDGMKPPIKQSGFGEAYESYVDL